jgi:hypothetical protein
MRNLAFECVKDMTDKVASAEVTKEGMTFQVYDQDTLTDISAEIQFPCVGVIYEGMASKGGNEKMGLACELYCSVILMAGDKNEEIRGHDEKPQISLLLDLIRGSILTTRAPSGHPWEFVLEFPLDVSHRGLGYYIKWKTTVILT